MRAARSRIFPIAFLITGLACCFEPSQARSGAPPGPEHLRSAVRLPGVTLLAQKSDFVNPVESEHRLFTLDIQNSIVYSLVVLVSSR
jgi:hypothetical protein